MLACGRVQSAVAIIVASSQRPSVMCGWHRLFVVYSSHRHRGSILINYPNNHQIAMLALSSSVLFVSYGRYVTEKLNKISENTKMCYKTSHKDSQTACKTKQRRR